MLGTEIHGASRKSVHFLKVPDTTGYISHASTKINNVISFCSDRIFTCSVDQRVSLWKIPPSDVGAGEDKNRFELIWQSFSNVPDLHDMVVVKNLDDVCVIVVGAGMQIFKLNL